jgi:hypothetical protein
MFPARLWALLGGKSSKGAENRDRVSNIRAWPGIT